ncbi:thermonuclease family protein [Pseudosulfitobacter sp. SM2401]|uniref:thermonuclease family protein n=1 Tax=Pseudosulfitobacter sp. SM2401 TaxID=3350098 RepID=UPI0036F38EB3
MEYLFISLVVLGFVVFAANGISKANRQPPPFVTPPPRPQPKPKKPTPSPAKPSQLQKPTKIEDDEVKHAPPPDIPASRELNGRAYVIDGDTIVVSKIKVRLAGIDAPELDQPWGQKSKWEMVRICKGNVLRVELTGETSYDRLVGTAYLADGRDIGAEIVKAGLALDGGHYSKGKYRHLEQPDMRAKLKRYGGWR